MWQPTSIKLDKEAALITHSLPWTPDSVILEGMFLIHTKPLPIHKTLGDYAHFVMTRFVLPHYYKGSKEVHLLFDNSGQMENPKAFEHARRDTLLFPDHACTQFVAEVLPPKKWQEALKCRNCKRGLTVFLSRHLLHNIGPLLPNTTQKFVTSGATNDLGTPMEVSKSTGPHPHPFLTNM